MACISGTFSPTPQGVWEKDAQHSYNFNDSVETINMNQPFAQTPPFVSVVVPVFNDPVRIACCLDALLNQNYPRESYEIIVVDNGSTDETLDIIRRYPVRVLMETTMQSSYAARNTGIKVSKGEIIAFTDSDCIPVPEWISLGVHALTQQKADLASGNVRFTFSLEKTGAEIFDSLTNMQIEQNITARNVSKTANLFVRSTVFEKVGLFPQDCQSGGDVAWTGLTTRTGCRLVYEHGAEVAHPARKLMALLKKQYRVGKGQPKIWRQSDVSFFRAIKRLLTNISFIQIFSVMRSLKKRELVLASSQKISLFVSGYTCLLTNFWGNIIGMKVYIQKSTEPDPGGGP